MARNRDRKQSSRKRAREPESEEEYEVERIKSHKIFVSKNKKSILKYLVKWIGYTDKESTWEPAESLENATALVDEYWEVYGGEENRKKVMKEIQGKTKEKKSADETNETEWKGESEDESDYSESEVNDKTFRSNANWDDIIKVKEVKYSEKERGLEGIVRWADGKLAAYPTTLIASKKPLKLVDFYEKFLAFEKA
ncbi:hypothetical protein BD560DRAFT_440529 [Blakeslea trispora]|nr:hypothetical protein BD560DRAFT_440529 [Blakeslea trispora]